MVERGFGGSICRKPAKSNLATSIASFNSTVPILERFTLGGRSGAAGHEYHHPNRDSSLPELLSHNTWTNGVGFEVLVEIVKRARGILS